MITYVIRQTEKVAPAPIHCIPNAPGLGGGEAITLCGWVDVEYREEEAAADCPDCLTIVAYCKGLDVPAAARMKHASATIERHWLEYPNGIPVEAWGRDHLSTLLYAEVRAVDRHGSLPPNDPRMRVDRRYPTRLHNGVEIHGHTD